MLSSVCVCSIRRKYRVKYKYVKNDRSWVFFFYFNVSEGNNGADKKDNLRDDKRGFELFVRVDYITKINYSSFIKK